MERVIDQIRKSLTPENIDIEVKKVWDFNLSPEIDQWIKEYMHVGLRQDYFIFKWLYNINLSWRLLDIDESLKETLCITKTLFNIFIILIDDISEQNNRDDLLKLLLRVADEKGTLASTHLNNKDEAYLRFTIKVWNEIDCRIKSLPQYDKYKAALDLDIFQLIGAVKYGKFITDHKFMMNELDYFHYFPFSMQIIINADIDLMCTDNFDEKELGRFREMVLTTQIMARIGNWLTTWEREVRADDYTSVVVPYCLFGGLIDENDFHDKDNLVKKIKDSDAENHFLDKWQELYLQAESIGKKLKTADGEHILERFRYLIKMHLISKNLK